MPGLRRRRIYGGNLMFPLPGTEQRIINSIVTAKNSKDYINNLITSHSNQLPGQYVRYVQNAVSTSILPSGIVQLPINQPGAGRKRRYRRRRRRM